MGVAAWPCYHVRRNSGALRMSAAPLMAAAPATLSTLRIGRPLAPPTPLVMCEFAYSLDFRLWRYRPECDVTYVLELVNQAIHGSSDLAMWNSSRPVAIHIDRLVCCGRSWHHI